MQASSYNWNYAFGYPMVQNVTESMVKIWRAPVNRITETGGMQKALIYGSLLPALIVILGPIVTHSRAKELFASIIKYFGIDSALVLLIFDINYNSKSI